MEESEYLKNNEKILQKLKQIPTLAPFDEKGLRGLLELSKIRLYEAGESILQEESYDSWISFCSGDFSDS